MIVIARSYGQLGNRLILFAHMIAASRRYGVPLANPCFADYAHLFPSTADDLWCRYPAVSPSKSPPSRRLRKATAKSVYLAARGLQTIGLTRYPLNIIRLCGEEKCDLADEEFASMVNQDRTLLTLGWLFRSDTLLNQNADAVRDHFRISESHRENVARVIGPLRDRADFVVGVHIRHGDYATYLNGKYFYSIDQYAAAMRSVVDQLPGKRVAFLVCSNAEIKANDFDGLDVQPGPGHIIEDMYSFAETDLLIGPPSTYTGWASFYGKVPLVAMEQADHPIDLASKLSRRAA